MTVGVLGQHLLGQGIVSVSARRQFKVTHFPSTGGQRAAGFGPVIVEV